ncbi:DUF2277 family protein, partial [Streptomyces albidoflavus]
MGDHRYDLSHLPDSAEATEDEIRAAALQYVRKVSGFRAPAAHNQ